MVIVDRLVTSTHLTGNLLLLQTDSFLYSYLTERVHGHLDIGQLHPLKERRRGNEGEEGGAVKHIRYRQEEITQVCGRYY